MTQFKTEPARPAPTNCSACDSGNFVDDDEDRTWACGRRWEFATGRWIEVCEHDPKAPAEPVQPDGGCDDVKTWPDAIARLGRMWLAIATAFVLYGVMRFEGSGASNAAVWAALLGFLVLFWS